MALLIEPHNHSAFAHILDDVFRLRRQVFVEGLGWEVPGDDGIHERDEFDDEHATHLVAFAPDGRIGGYLRILRGDRPMLISKVFPDTLDLKPVPTGPDVREDSRLLTSPHITDKATRVAIGQDINISHLEYAFSRGVKTIVVYTGLRWIANTARMGLEIEMLGTPRMVAGEECAPAAFHISEEVKGIVQANFGAFLGRLEDPDQDPSLITRYGRINAAA